LTGEGKSILLGFTAIIFALLNFNVDVASYSEYLTQRDYNDFKELFTLLGVKEKIFYGTF
jgi:preprotein translocase subunit SecA